MGFARLATAARWLTLATGVAFVAACSDDDDNGGTTTPTPLAAPSGVAASAAGQTGATVTWSAVTGATSYVVQRAPGASGGTFAEVGRPTTVTFTDAGLTASTTYRYQVAAVRGGETSAFSAAATVTTGAPTQAGPRQRTLTGTLATQSLSADTTYVLSGFVQVPSGQTLTIAAGTRLVGDTTVPGSALFVLKGARIVANGTATAPIVFTSQRAAGNRRPGDWGGLIVIGNARLSRPSPVLLEGSNANVGGVQYPGVDIAGGTNDDDDSGTLRYVRVEFAGFAVTQDNELNAFTFASVGRRTTVEYLQALGGLDDSFEWFGGTVDGRYLVSYLAGDDHFDAAEGYRGRNQFLIALQDTVLVPRQGAGQIATDPAGFEIDGCNVSGTNCPSQSATPFTTPVFANFTVIGGGTAIQQTSGGNGMVIRRGAGGFYVNGVVARWGRLGLTVRDSSTNNRRLADSLLISNVLFAENGAALDPSTSAFTQPTLFANRGIDSTATATTALFSGIPALTAVPTTATLNFSLAASSPAATGGLATFTGALAARSSNFFGGTLSGTAYRGAVAPGGTPWWQGWTSYARN